MLFCFYTKGSKDISHINCFYFCYALVLCFHSSSLTDVLEMFFVLLPTWSHTPSFLPAITCPCSLIRASVTCNSHTHAALPWQRDAPGRQLPGQGHHFPASLGVSWRQVTEFFWPWAWEGCILLPDLVYYTQLLCSYLLSHLAGCWCPGPLSGSSLWHPSCPPTQPLPFFLSSLTFP